MTPKVEETIEKQTAMYMKLPKKKIVEMLIESNQSIDIFNSEYFTVGKFEVHTLRLALTKAMKEYHESKMTFNDLNSMLKRLENFITKDHVKDDVWIELDEC